MRASMPREPSAPKYLFREIKNLCIFWSQTTREVDHCADFMRQWQAAERTTSRDIEINEIPKHSR